MYRDAEGQLRCGTCDSPLVRDENPFSRPGSLVCPRWSRGSEEPHDEYVQGRKVRV